MTDVERRIADRFPSRFLRGYARSKLRRDPVYRAVADRLRGSTFPLYDVGCGVGLLEFFLREQGFEEPMTGIDHDARKVVAANEIARDSVANRSGLHAQGSLVGVRQDRHHHHRK